MPPEFPPVEKLNHYVKKAQESGRTGEILLAIEPDDSRPRWSIGNPDRPFLLASATKLFVTALLARLRTEGSLDWNAPRSATSPKQT